MGLTIENGIAFLKEITVDKFTAKTARLEKIEMVDKATGEIYCTWVENGEWIKEKGLRYYDLNGINPETNPGTYHFKRGLAGKKGRWRPRPH